MRNNKYINLTFSLLFTLFLFGSVSNIYAQSDGDACTYVYFPAIATLKINKHVSTVVEFTSKTPPLKEVKEFYIRGGQLDRLGLKGYFGFDDILPAKIGHLVKGDCNQKSYKIREEYYKVVQTEIHWFNDDYTDKEHTEEVNHIYKNFAALKSDFPNATLMIYGHLDQRKQHEYSSNSALSYADTIKTMLIAKGLDAEALQTSAYHNDLIPDMDSKLIYEKVTFKIELNY